MKKYLLIAPNWVGDIIMMQSLIFALNKKKIIIDVLAPKMSEGLIAKMPYVNKIIPTDFSHGKLELIKRFTLAKKLKQNNYHAALILPRSFKSALIPYFAKIKNRVSFKTKFRNILLTKTIKRRKTILNGKINDKTLYRYLSLFIKPKTDKYEFDYQEPKLQIYQKKTQELIVKFSLNSKKNIIAICPGAEFGKSKLWPWKNFKDLLKKLIKEDLQIIILGSNKEKEIAQKIIQNIDSKKIKNLVGKTKLEDAVELLNLAKVSITHDSGLMHIASATKTKTIAIYGSTSKEFTPPLNKSAVIFSAKNLDCAPCFKRKCKFGHYNCLLQTTVSDVFLAIKENLYKTDK